MPAREDFPAAEGFERDVQKHEPALRSYLRGRFPASIEVDDLVQETFARYFRAAAASAIDQPRGYLFRTARNLAFDLCRRQKSRNGPASQDVDLESLPEESPDPAQRLSTDHDLGILSAAIDGLPARCGMILRLCRLQGLSYREIAAQMGIAESTVSAQLAIALIRCRRHFRACGALDRDSHAGEP